MRRARSSSAPRRTPRLRPSRTTRRPLAKARDDLEKIIAGDVLLGVSGAVAISGAIWLVVELTQDPTATTAIRPAPRGLEIVF